MAEINKLPVEKALDEEIERMRTQRLRLEQHQRRRDKGNR
jgi:hypothetical protein